MFKYRRILWIISGISAILAMFTAAYSVFHTSVYHPSTPEHLLPGAVSQDVFSILASAGILICIYLTWKGREKSWLILPGLQSYLFYAYALYSFDRVYNYLFLLYVAIAGLSVYSLILFFLSVHPDSVAEKQKSNLPGKTAAVLFLVLAVVFLSLWLSILVPAMVTGIPPEGNAIFVLDLGFFIPLLTITAVLLLREKPLGYLITVPLLVKMAALGFSVLTASLIGPAFGQTTSTADLVIYTLLGAGPVLLIPVYLSRLDFSVKERR